LWVSELVGLTAEEIESFANIQM
jgi:hypothetical protein